MSGTTIYGSTAVCSAVGKFTSCIDVGGTGTFTGDLTINKNNSTDAIFKVQQSTNFYASAITLIAANDGGAGYNYINSSTSGGTTHWQIGGGATANTMAMYTSGSERMRITSTGAACFACELTAKTLGTNDLILNNLNYECANYVDGTRGSWLIQEGACDLFIINQVSCKKYKFNLIEIK
jgi:hypothetical protein